MIQAVKKMVAWLNRGAGHRCLSFMQGPIAVDPASGTGEATPYEQSSAKAGSAYSWKPLFTTPQSSSSILQLFTVSVTTTIHLTT